MAEKRRNNWGSALSNIRKISVLLFCFSVFFYLPIANAKHKATHGASAKKYQSTSQKIEKKYNQYKKQVKKAFADYVNKTAKVWGKDTVVPSAAVNVTYHNNLSERSVMDFTKGKVKVELAINKANMRQPQVLRNRLSEAVRKTILMGADTRSIIAMAEQPDAPASALSPVLKGLVADKEGRPLQKKTITDFLFSATESYQLRQITGADGTTLIAISTEFSLIERHLIVRSKMYEAAVSRNARQHLIPSPLIYAIMEIESSFNPTARSPIPAFGLMQLVPAQGARDAYRFLHAKDAVVKDTYLYQPDNNIDLGVAYLHILYFRYLKYIKNPDAKKWAAVAAYNTGVNNVLGSFVGKFNRTTHGSRWSWRKKAMNKINSLSAEEVYQHMLLFLPYQETRDYIKKVRASMPKYDI